MRKYSRRHPLKNNRASIVWLVVFILISAWLIAHMGCYWMGIILGAYLMLAFASVLLRGRPADDARQKERS